MEKKKTKKTNKAKVNTTKKVNKKEVSTPKKSKKKNIPNKGLAPVLIAIFTLIVLVFGAAYAYFAVTTINNFGTSTVNVAADVVGTVSLSSGDSLTLSVDALDMANPANNNVDYYAVPIVTSGTQDKYATSQAQAPVIGTAIVTGDGYFDCDYTLVVTPSYTTASMLQALKNMTSPEPTTGQLILYVNGTAYDLYTYANNTTGDRISDVTGSVVPLEIDGSFTGINSSTNGTITAQLKLVNIHGLDGGNVANSQNDLAGTDMTLTFSIKPNSFACEAIDPNSLNNP